MNPAQANMIKLRRGALFPDDVPIWPTIAVPAGTVIALDPLAFVSAFGSAPQIDTSNQISIQMQTTPSADLLTGSPAKSMVQVDCIATRLLLRAAWTWRIAGAVAWVQGAAW